MTPKLFKTNLATYIQAEYTGSNPSGWHPLGDKLLVKADSVADVTAGNIKIPDDIRDRMTMAAEAGVVIAVGDGAFMFDSNSVTPFLGRKPKPGDRIAMGRYSGQLMKGHDGENYRIMSSSEVGAIEEAKEETNVH